jgi:hypothetical protein
MPPFSVPKPTEYVTSRVSLLSSSAPREVLAAVGDLARRSTRHPVGRETLSEALLALSPADVCAALAEIDAQTCEESLGRAAAEAFEAAFSDSPEERELFAEAAIAGLLVRDRIESTLFAASTFAELSGDADVTRAVRDAEDRLAPVDLGLVQRHARMLTGVNRERRACLHELDPQLHERAVWFTSRVDDDVLLGALAGDASPAAAYGDGVKADLARSALPSFTRLESGRRDFSDFESSALFHVALGQASSAERELLGLRAEKDDDLALALREAHEIEDVPE